MRQQRQHRKQLKPSDSLQEKSEKLHLLAQKQLERLAGGFEGRQGQLPLTQSARSKKEHQQANRTSDAVDNADSKDEIDNRMDNPLSFSATIGPSYAIRMAADKQIPAIQKATVLQSRHYTKAGVKADIRHR